MTDPKPVSSIVVRAVAAVEANEVPRSQICIPPLIIKLRVPVLGAAPVARESEVYF